ncbi:MAG: thioredoxin fold domain-containing protein, partial [Pseudomonadota bacterium]
SAMQLLCGRFNFAAAENRMKQNLSTKSLSKFGICLLALFGFGVSAMELERSLVEATDLSRDGGMVKDQRVLMIEFSSEYCAFCRKLEKEFLTPMLQNDEYHKKVLIRTLSLSDDNDIVDFNGHTVSASELASRYDVDLTPTLLFLGSDGREISERLVGIWSTDFYGGFIDERIESGLSALK